MKKLSFIRLIQALAVMNGLLLIMLLVCMVPLSKSVLRVLLLITAILFFVVSIIEMILGWKMYRGKTEKPDERDVLLMQRAADKAISSNKLVLCALVVIFLFVWVKAEPAPLLGLLFGIVGIHLPSFIKYCFFLHYERIEEEEVFE